MTNNIYPPDHLLGKWEELIFDGLENVNAVLYEAFQAGADQELEACCKWMASETPEPYINALRAARRPKPPSLAEKALEALETEDDSMPLMSLKRSERFELIRRALERLQELEGQGDD